MRITFVNITLTFEDQRDECYAVNVIYSIKSKHLNLNEVLDLVMLF